jgi:hypothetical protein
MRVLPAFALYHSAAEESDQEEWHAFHELLLEYLRYDGTSMRDCRMFAAFWLLPRPRRRLRDRMTRRPSFRLPVGSR